MPDLSGISDEQLRVVAATANSLRTAMEMLGRDPGDTTAIRHFKQWAVANQVTLRVGAKRHRSSEEVAGAVLGAKSQAEVLRRLGLEAKSANYALLGRLAAEHGLELPVRGSAKREARLDFDAVAVAEAARTHPTRRSILTALGVAPTAKHLAQLARFAAEAGVTLPPATAKATGVFADMAAVAGAIERAHSVRHALDILGVAPNTANRARLERVAAQMGVDLPQTVVTYGGVPLLEMLREGVEIKNQAALKRKLIEAGILVEQCAVCALRAEWQGRSLVLQLDHVNGDRLDNRRENLRLLCPNCHSQTETFGARNSVRAARATTT